MADEVIARLVGRLGFEVEPEGLEDFNKGLGEAEKGSKAAGVGGIALGNILADVAGAAANAALELVGMGAALAKDVVFGFVESGTEIDKWSKTIGIGVEELQELQFAAKAVAGEEGAEALNEALTTLEENLGELARVGSGPAKDSLGSLGLELSDFDALSPAEDLELFAQALSEAPDDAEKLSIAMEVLGGEGKTLKPLLDLGAEGISGMRDRARELGVVLDEEAIAKAKETAVAMAEMDAAVEGAGNQIAVALAPQITEAAQSLTRWIGENDKLIQQDIPAFIDATVESGAALLAWAIETGEEFEYLGTQIVIVAESLEDTLVSAYETAEPVISFVSDVIDEQVVALGNVLEFIESMVGRLESARAIVGEIEAGLGLGGEPTTSVRGAPSLASSGQDQPQLRSVNSLGSSELEAALGQPGLNTKTRAQILARMPAVAFKEASEAQAAANSARMLVEEGAAELQSGLDKARAAAGRKRRGEKFRRTELAEGGGGVNTREAKRLLGDEIERLAATAGLGRKAVKGALEAAARVLAGGGATDVARAAAVKQLEGLGGPAAQGPDAALFGELSKVIGGSAARSATAGARLVTIDQSVTTTVTIERVEVPSQFADAMGNPAMAQGLTAALEQALARRDAQIMDAVELRHQRP